MPPEVEFSLPLIEEDREAEFARAARRRVTVGRNDTWGEDENFSLRYRWLGAVGIVALLLLFSIWVLAHAWNAHRHKTAHAAAAVSHQAAGGAAEGAAEAAAQAAKKSAAPSAKQIAASPAPRPVAGGLPGASLVPSAGSRSSWRVIPFTYNRKADADKKVASLAGSHPDLQPAVFTPNGHAPYLVSVGGVMGRDAAYALAARSGSLGLPRDTYAQNYSH
jgi:hypothetical protein